MTKLAEFVSYKKKLNVHIPWNYIEYYTYHLNAQVGG